MAHKHKFVVIKVRGFASFMECVICKLVADLPS